MARDVVHGANTEIVVQHTASAEIPVVQLNLTQLIVPHSPPRLYCAVGDFAPRVRLSRLGPRRTLSRIPRVSYGDPPLPPTGRFVATVPGGSG